MDSEATFSYTDGFVEFGAGVVIPTADIYSDVSLIALLLTIVPTNELRLSRELAYLAITFGKMMIIPLILSTLFILPHWLKCEENFKRRLITFPLVLLQLYPQYRSMRVLWWAFFRKNVSHCLKEKHHNDCSISYVGKFLCFSKKYSGYSFSSTFEFYLIHFRSVCRGCDSASFVFSTHWIACLDG